MADEIIVGVSLGVVKGALVNRYINQCSATMNGTHMESKVQDIGSATHEILSLGTDFANMGWIYLKNTDTTNDVSFGLDNTGTFLPLINLKAGEGCVVRLITKNVYAKSSAGTVQLIFCAFED